MAGRENLAFSLEPIPDGSGLHQPDPHLVLYFRRVSRPGFGPTPPSFFRGVIGRSCSKLQRSYGHLLNCVNLQHGVKTGILSETSRYHELFKTQPHFMPFRSVPRARVCLQYPTKARSLVSLYAATRPASNLASCCTSSIDQRIYHSTRCEY